MKKIITPKGLIYFKSELLSKYDNEILHFFTTRIGGKSSEPYNELNLGYTVGDNSLTVSQNRQLLADEIGFRLENCVTCFQVHGIETQVVEKQHKGCGSFDVESSFHDFDSLVSSEREICLLSLAADCVPLLFYDYEKKVVGTTHAGWRGTVQGAALHAINKMKSTFNSLPENIIACIGPSISVNAYEVGDEVVEAVFRNFPDSSEVLVKNAQTQRFHFDLWKANRLKLLEAGLLAKHIETADLCTFSNYNLFFSARKGKHKTGRFAGGIMLR